MNITLVSEDLELKELIEKQDFFDHVEFMHEYDETAIAQRGGSCLVLSDSIVDYKDLSTIRLNEDQTVIYMMKNHHNVQLELSINAVCSSRGIILVPSRLTTQQVADFIVKTFKSEDTLRSKVVTFFSPLSNIGTTSTCLSVARCLEEKTDEKIGVLLLNAWDKGTYSLEYKGKYLNQMKGRLANKAISTKEEFLSNFHMYSQDRLYILGGNSDVKLERLYTKEEIDYLIELAKKHFDIVLIDAGSHFDNVNILQSLYHSDMKFLVMNQQYKGIAQFNSLYDEILYPLGYKKTDFIMVVNQVIDSSQLLTPRAVSDETDVLLLASIYQINNAWTTETELVMLYDKNELYRDSIRQITKSVISQYNLKLKESLETTKKRRKWLSFSR